MKRKLLFYTPVKKSENNNITCKKIHLLLGRYGNNIYFCSEIIDPS